MKIMEGQHSFPCEKRKRKKKEKDVGEASKVQRLHEPYRQGEKVETNQMTQ